MIKIAILGCGTVGYGVVKLLQQNSDIIAMRAGEPVTLKWVMDLDKNKCRALGIDEALITDKFDDVLNDSEVDIVAELIGGIEPAFSFIAAAMKQGKHIVTANKDLIAVKGKDIFELAESNQVDFYFEASVAGGIPIIAPLKQSLAGNHIQQIIGILNGTTNYILTKMSREGRDFNDVLAEAQQKGYAESDPSADIEGLDAARKIAILSSIAFNSRVTLDDVYVEGISGITPEDIKYADELGFIIKLLAIGQEKDGKVQTRVHPAFLPKNHPLAAVNDVFNAVFIQGDAVGEIMHFGRGAGQMPTASSVMGDIIEIVRNIRQHTNARIGCTCYEDKQTLSIDCLAAQFYIRMTVTDRPGVLAGIAGVFGEHNVSLATVLQKASRQEMAELILITHEVKEKDLRDSLIVLKDMPIVDKINNVIRLEGV
ncbi:MAG TPA: homoserine dehydrogenase [Syntrophomonadaceae bacterium]|nr:homoserine dehydrogenase [Syntrophomonadaceae bacterium]HPR94638.1 homoserine dehydrogenase [Syntrophomonadaceae bacterium]